MKAVLSVIGKDNYGILAEVSKKCAEYHANVLNVSQSIMGDYFTMIMIVNVDNLTVEFTNFVDIMKDLGTTNKLEIHVMHEDIFNSMHKI